MFVSGGIFLAISEETKQLQGLALAIQKAKDLNKPVLFSHVKKIECQEPPFILSSWKRSICRRTFLLARSSKENYDYGFRQCEETPGDSDC